MKNPPPCSSNETVYFLVASSLLPANPRRDVFIEHHYFAITVTYFNCILGFCFNMYVVACSNFMLNWNYMLCICQWMSPLELTSQYALQQHLGICKNSKDWCNLLNWLKERGIWRVDGLWIGTGLHAVLGHNALQMQPCQNTDPELRHSQSPFPVCSLLSGQ